MEHVNKEFVENLYKFVSDIVGYTGLKGPSELLGEFNKLDMNEIIKNFCSVMGKFGDCIVNNNETIFGMSLVIFPHMDMNEIWPLLTPKQKSKVWVYLKILYITANMLNQEMEGDNTSLLLATTQKSEILQREETDNLCITKLGFNPYVGIGSDNSNMSVDDIHSSLSDGMTETSGSFSSISNVTNMAKSLGLDKMLKLDELVSKLNEMNEEEIDKATTGMKTVLGDICDGNTANFVTDVLGDVAKEIKKSNLKEGDVFENVINIAKKVTENMEPVMEANNIKPEDIFKITEKMTSKCMDKNGKNGQSPFPPGENPFAMFSTMLSQLHPGLKETMESQFSHLTSESFNSENISDTYNSLLANIKTA